MVFSPFLRHVPGEMVEIMSFLSNCTVILSFSSNYDFVPAVIYPNSISSSYYLEKNSFFISQKLKQFLKKNSLFEVYVTFYLCD